MAGDEVFVVRDVTKRFGSRTILDRISFDVRRGEILGLIGASGTGKTTLLHMLVGFVPSSSGSIIFCGTMHGKPVERDVLTNQRALSRVYGFASQVPSFYERLTVRENLEYFGHMYDLSPDAIGRNATTLLELMGLKASAHLLAMHLSGGMQRRLDIACALIHDPPILVLDEPTADLDPVLRTHVWEVIKRINARGTTVVLSSHHLNDLDTLCTRIAILKDGRIIDVDTPEKLKSKHGRTQEILIESFPGNYAPVIKRLQSEKLAEEVRHEGTYLIVRTAQAETLLTSLLALLKKNGESLLDVKLVKPNLDDVFVRLHAGHGQKASLPPPAAIPERGAR